MPIYKGAGKKLTDIDLPKVGRRIGVGEDVIHALLEVETRGTGFDQQGRVIMLFEPHKFYHHLHGEELAQAVEEGLAYPRWGMQRYPKDSYPRLEKALAINETAALLSCSWGLGQLMGENFHMAHYKTVQDMVAAFADSEEKQLEAMIDFINSAGISDDLRRIERIAKAGHIPTAGDWVPVVRVYNGPAYVKNQYHIRAQKAFARWMKIKDTPFTTEQIANLPSITTLAAEEEAQYPVHEIEPEVPDSPPEETSHEDLTPEPEQDKSQPPVQVETPAPPKTDNPAPENIVLNPVVPDDKTSKKSLYTVVGTVVTAATAWLTSNIGEALGYIKGLDHDVLRYLVIGTIVVVSLYLLRQIIGKIITEVGAIIYNVKAMKYHADQSSNNVSMASPAPKEG